MKKLVIYIFIAFSLSSCHFGKMLIYNVADINDYKKFPQVELYKSEKPYFFKEKLNFNIDTISIAEDVLEAKNSESLGSFLEKNKTTSFLIIKNDTIIYEKYFYNFSDSSIFTSFSVNKSFVSALIGIAIGEGEINSVHDPITKYLNFFKNDGFEKITIEHLLNMRSGIRYRENYFNPFAEVGLYYYGPNSRKYVKNLKIKEEAGENYEYVSVNTLLLAMILEKATGTKIDDYYQRKLWQPLGMEFDASLNIDSKKSNMVKAYCCLNARTRDFARFGCLYLNNGKFNGKQIVPYDWVRETLKMEKEVEPNIFYKYQWRSDKNKNFWAKGFLGQYIFVNPSKKIVIVRTGKKADKIKWEAVFADISNKI